MDEMPVEISGLAEAFATDLRRAVARAYYAGLEAGVQKGAQEMREAILRAAQLPVAKTSLAAQLIEKLENVRGSMEARSSERAPRGAVRRAITAVLRHRQGLTELEIGDAASGLDPNVSPRSVGAELRRLKDRRYRMENGRWFLIPAPLEEETAGPMTDPAEDKHPTNGEPSDGTPLAA